jgi:hypothetical protein
LRERFGCIGEEEIESDQEHELAEDDLEGERGV